ncbi:MAG TPA: G1 family glutamic endopeptidase [Methylomirabilota bacterium]|nr:G1 family glutamic endopeptidase [Methylomirabilota bacterium]
MTTLREIEEDLKLRLHLAPQPPDGFDPLSATAEQLEQFGLPPRPDARLHEAAFRVWERMMSQPLQILPPVFPVLTGKFDYRINVRMLVLRRPVSNLESSSNWSGGYITANHTRAFLMVFGSWTIPTPNQPAGAPDGDYRCATWIGLDGVRRYSDSLPQLGTTQTVVVASGVTTRTVEAWWQWWIRGANNPPVPFPAPFTVAIGQQVTCGLVVISSTRVRIFMKNDATGQFARYDVDAPGAASSLATIAALRGANAEWIAERPMQLGSTILYPLADYGSVDFSNCLTVVPAQVRDLRGARFIRMKEMRLPPLRSKILSSAGKVDARQTVMRVRYRA